MTEEKTSIPDKERKLRQIFLYYDRFTAVLNRFLQKKLETEITVTLSALEDESGILGTSPDRIMFCASFSDSTAPAAVIISRSFLLGIIDIALGNGQFTPDSSPHIWTELDEELAAPFIERLAEILIGFSGNLPPGERVELMTSENYHGGNLCYRLSWEIIYGGITYPLEFILPEQLAELPLPEPIEKIVPKQDAELLRYIEMRRATSEKKQDADTDGSGNLTARVLIGSFNLTRADLDSMRPGDILSTDIPADAPFQLIIDQNPPIPVHPGENEEEKAVIID